MKFCSVKVILLILFLFSLPAAIFSTGLVSGDNYWVYMIPGDSGQLMHGSYGLIDWINRANTSIYAALAFFSNMSVAEALVNAKNRGVIVKVVVDDDSQVYDAVQYLINNGIEVRDDSSYEQTAGDHTMHLKYLVIDNSTVIFGSANPTDTGLGYNNETLLIFYNVPSIAYYFLQEFDELWAGTFAGGTDVSGCTTITLTDSSGSRNADVCVYFGPEHLLNDTLYYWVNRANKSIYFALYLMTTSSSIKSVLNEIISKNQSGIDVRGLFDNELNEDYRYSAYFWLYRNGTTALVFDRNLYKLHNKLFVIDNNTVLVGSYNPTGTATTDNDEVLVVIRDPVIAEAFAQAYLGTWKKWYGVNWTAVHPIITEVYVEPGGNNNEWIEIYNPAPYAYNITGWVISDYYNTFSQTTSAYECAYIFPNKVLEPGEYIIVAYDAATFESNYGFAPSFEIAGTDPNVPDLQADTNLCDPSTSSMDLYERYDEVLLFKKSYDFYMVIDAVWWGNETAGYTDWYISSDGYGEVDVSNMPQGYTIQRVSDPVDGPIPREVFTIAAATPTIGVVTPVPEPLLAPLIVASAMIVLVFAYKKK